MSTILKKFIGAEQVGADQILLENNKNIEFLIPKTGALKTIEYITIFNNAKNIDESYEFINFIIHNDHKPDSISTFNKISKNIFS